MKYYYLLFLNLPIPWLPTVHSADKVDGIQKSYVNN